jgi:hypothetical protein
MTKNVVPMKPAKVPAALASIFQVNSDDLTSGVSGGFGVLSIRASKWRIKYQGGETLVTNDDGETVPSIEVVLLKASKAVSKLYYDKPYVDGTNESPTCYSADGVAPDAGVPNPQATSCAVCKWSQWGSKITEAGKKAKACSDHRRVAVVPSGDLANEGFGGPMLLRVPPASLADLAVFGQKVAAKGFPYNAIITRLGFDPQASYPKLTFKAVRPLTEDELAEVAKHFHGDVLNRILSEASELAVDAPAAAAPEPELSVDADFEMDAPPAAPKRPVAAPAAARQAKPAPRPRAAPAAAPAAPAGDLDDDLNEIISSLDDLG